MKQHTALLVSEMKIHSFVGYSETETNIKY